ncbi:hypothetical protein JCM10914A_52930 [Paenibacillus sp. JCM 10914]|uniref:DUF6171 family protein n=1 Tax=Paenibacillus sp. JCM 10914 TaxID=1236974 RepID=UPI0003CC5913|nr:DUF6171 family protein [Paenibacillus sp. JCM 10914]GAE04987.1 hypothetical protein JCM10914_1069 [Paenibacillus sp. JCM 10914]
MADNRCKGCRDDYRVSSEQIERVLAAAMFHTDDNVSDEWYDARLEACMSCPKLQGGTTCMLCGCIVQITAKMRDKRCPYPGDDRWAEAVQVG